MKLWKLVGTTALAALLEICHPTTCSAALIANFDSFKEGSIGSTFSDGGITFTNPDEGLGVTPGDFIIEQANGTLAGDPGFSTPNALGFEGYVPGPGASYGTFKSMTFSGGPASSASLSLFYSASTDNDLTLEAFLGGTEVASQSLSEATSSLSATGSLMVTAPRFDSVELVSTGTDNGGRSFILVDNVSVVPVPEPAWTGVLMIAAGALVLGRRRRCTMTTT